MRVYFRNSYWATVSVAIMRYDPHSCGGEYGNWATAGWWVITPGQQVWAFSTNNRYAYFYAEAVDSASWFGPYGSVHVYHDAFESCLGIGSTASYGVVGMRLIDVGNSDHVVNLTAG